MVFLLKTRFVMCLVFGYLVYVSYYSPLDGILLFLYIYYSLVLYIPEENETYEVLNRRLMLFSYFPTQDYRILQ